MTSGAYIATTLILDQERCKCRGKGQANAQVSFEAAKRASIGYYYHVSILLVGRGAEGAAAVACSYAGIYFLIFRH